MLDLAHLHSLSLLHCDLKHGNVLVRTDKKGGNKVHAVSIADWGTLTYLGEGESHAYAK